MPYSKTSINLFEMESLLTSVTDGVGFFADDLTGSQHSHSVVVFRSLLCAL